VVKRKKEPRPWGQKEKRKKITLCWKNNTSALLKKKKKHKKLGMGVGGHMGKKGQLERKRSERFVSNGNTSG